MHENLESVIRSVRPALNDAQATAQERADFLYELVREVYNHVKFDVHDPTDDTDERMQIGDVLNAALPPIL